VFSGGRYGIAVRMGWAWWCGQEEMGTIGGWLVGVLVCWSGLGEEFCIKAEQKGMISNNKTERTNHPPRE